ncbi:MAG: YHS domain-containing (seleno)protein [Verrucomicrobiota bacterium]
MKRILSIILLLVMTLPALAQSKSLLNLDKARVAIQGYDPVAFFTDGKPVKGKPELGLHHNGALYLFRDQRNIAILSKPIPPKYVPAFGGYCAYGVSRGKLVEIDVEAFQIVDGNLLMQYSKGVRNDFNKDAKGNLSKAEANWPSLVEKKGK